ncbi:CLOCK-interacting pacemaker isoform X2 [Takifugu rubripes]|nr:CLOCK-interacting pacemaker-like isoform X2 [Takifugu rubripes]XP_029704011.1 CLOCK-interacting pacemaker-like isoform X2 [Takifugu rubripes]
MPKEQGRFWEETPHCSSKTAKNKSNSATLQAALSSIHRDQSGMGDRNAHMVLCDGEKDSEKDSGYSETGSESVHTDLNDEHKGIRTAARDNREGFKCDNNVVIATGCNMAPYEDFTPIYIIKNLVVKPSQSEQLLHGSLAWGGGWQGLDNPKTPTQYLLIQQPAIAVPSSSTLSPSSGAAPQMRKGGNRCKQSHSSKTSYLPILNSYPRIAPHPRKDSSEGKGASVVEAAKEGGSEGQHQSKRVCIEGEKREAVSTTTGLPKPQQHHRVKGRVRDNFSSSLHLSLPSHSAGSSQHKHQHHQHHPGPGSDSVGSPSVSSSQTPSPPSSSSSPSSSSPPSSSPPSSITHSPRCPAPDSSSSRHRRFQNTAEVLNQSGLLAIALRTKELLKQNAATDREIAQLHQHTHLLCQVVQSSQNKCHQGSSSLDQLLQTMAESGCYPRLELNQVKVLSSDSRQDKRIIEEDSSVKLTEPHQRPTQVVSLHSTDDGIAPPSPLFAPSPDAEELERGGSFLDTMSIPISYSTCGSDHFNQLSALPGT